MLRRCSEPVQHQSTRRSRQYPAKLIGDSGSIARAYTNMQPRCTHTAYDSRPYMIESMTAARAATKRQTGIRHVAAASHSLPESKHKVQGHMAACCRHLGDPRCCHAELGTVNHTQLSCHHRAPTRHNQLCVHMLEACKPCSVRQTSMSHHTPQRCSQDPKPCQCR